MKRTLVIKGQLCGLNEYTKACRSNKYAGAKMKEKAQIRIGFFIMNQFGNLHFDKPVKLEFRWFEPNKKRDLDNICFAKKFILDALVKCHTINNDNWNGVAGFTDKFFVDKENPRIEVDIWEEGEENGESN